MIAETVPNDLPLTDENDATETYVVTDAQGELCGVYYTLNRACAYISDWLKAGDISVSPDLNGSGPWEFNGYLIRKTHLRK